MSFGVGREARSTSRRLGSLPIEALSSAFTLASFSQRLIARCRPYDRLLRPKRPKRSIWKNVRSTRPLSIVRSKTLWKSSMSLFESRITGTVWMPVPSSMAITLKVNQPSR